MKINAYNITEKESAFLANVNTQSGTYDMRFDVRDGVPSTELSSRIYFYKMRAGGYTNSKKLILIK